MRLIDADALDPHEVYMNYGCQRIVYMDDIDEAPTMEAEPTRHGKWIKVGDNTYRCSRCNKVSCCNGNFCTDCGARMDEEEL